MRAGGAIPIILFTGGASVRTKFRTTEIIADGAFTRFTTFFYYVIMYIITQSH